MASAFFPAMRVGSAGQGAVESVAIGSLTKTAEMMLGSAAAAGVSVGGLGAAPAPAGLPQLNRPPVPPTSTAPAPHVPDGPPTPEFAQSYVAPLAGLNSIRPSSVSQPPGAARAWRAKTPKVAATAAEAMLSRTRRECCTPSFHNGACAAYSCDPGSAPLGPPDAYERSFRRSGPGARRKSRRGTLGSRR